MGCPTWIVCADEHSGLPPLVFHLATATATATATGYASLDICLRFRLCQGLKAMRPGRGVRARRDPSGLTLLRRSGQEGVSVAREICSDPSTGIPAGHNPNREFAISARRCIAREPVYRNRMPYLIPATIGPHRKSISTVRTVALRIDGNRATFVLVEFTATQGTSSRCRAELAPLIPAQALLKFEVPDTGGSQSYVYSIDFISAPALIRCTL
ncbi:hypothetical protein DSM43276_03323 [Mycobacteroides salmoniphilum]|nr:hypothetical protein DSM43276_03323 [Mycobacteroides salmoniphilum]